MVHKDVSAKIVSTLSYLSTQEALLVLNDVFRHILEQNQLADGSCGKMRPFRMLTSRNALNRVNQDPEVRAFILSMTGPITIKEIRAKITKRFGAERTPSKSGLGRYLKALERG